MLFHVKMTVKLPADMDPARAAQIKAEEKELAQRLMREGTWRHLWRIAGQYSNVSIFDVETVQDLHDLVSTLPLFPFMTTEVTALCRHPSAIDGR